MREELLRIGFLELACYLKSDGRAAGTDWEPVPGLTGRETRILLMREYDRWKSGEYKGGPDEAGRLLGISEAGVFCLLMIGLSVYSEDFREALRLVDDSVLKGARILYEKNHGQRVPSEDRSVLEVFEPGGETLSATVFLRTEGEEGALPDGLGWFPELTKREKLIWKDARAQAEKIYRFGEREAISAVCVCGPAGAGKAVCAGEWSALGFEKSGRVLMADLESGCAQGVSPAVCAVLAVCRGAVLCLSHMNKEQWPLWKPWAQWMRQRGSLLFISCETEGTDRGPLEDVEEILHVFLKVPAMTERRRIWKLAAEAFELKPGVRLDTIANQYRLTPGQIMQILRMASRRAGYMGREVISDEDVEECCHRLLRKNFGSRAMKMEVRHCLDDLVLPAYQKAKLLAACDQVKYRHQVLEQWGLGEKMTYGTGVSLIFAGPPGTGKTMAAQILAGRLGMELYRVELSAVVSKYIGETEKNLEQIFAAARGSQVALFFDEADVLFGRRTEVRDSNDKYSNMEAAFLLQKMEEYDGVVILATNLLKNMDEAFKRRMKFIIDFPFPGPAERLEIWKRAIPASMPAEELDLEFLAERFELSGSNIRNIVYHAGFLAAGAGRAVRMEDLIRALRNEYEKGDKMLTRQEAEPYGVYLESDGRE